MPHSAENVKGGTLLDLLTYNLLQKNSKEDPLGTLKKFFEKSHSAEKKSKEGPPLVSFGLVGYVKMKGEFFSLGK